MKTIVSILLIVCGIAGGAAYYTKYVNTKAPASFRTASIKRGNLTVSISATGTVEPEEVIDVGAQVAGKVIAFGPDPNHPGQSLDYGSTVHKDTLLATIKPNPPSNGKTIDFCSVVQKDQLLATIDPTLYAAQVTQAEASLARAEADLLQYQAKLEQTEQEWKRAEILRPKNAIADTDYDLAVSNYHVAQANVAVGKAAKRQAEAALSIAKTNFDYTVIKSPVEGTIIARRVNVGQTVVASLNTPSMFLIAKDLRRMQVWASVNEADIGRIRIDMPVWFTVDAFPGETFQGTVTQIRMNAQMTQNIVLYTVVVTTDNSNLKLLPYLTASLHFEVARHNDVLLVPNAAMRWKPKSVAQIAPDALKNAGANEEEAETPDKPAGSTEEYRRLWVADGNFVRPLDVIVGQTDGTMTQISGQGVKEGIEVITGEGNAESAANADATTNPFLPKFPGKNRNPK
jgi:HlyD family secretion protein